MTGDEAKAILAGRYIVNIDGDDEYCEKVNEALDMAIEALSIVRCKDCKYIDEHGWCEFMGGFVHDGFCAWAERREP